MTPKKNYKGIIAYIAFFILGLVLLYLVFGNAFAQNDNVKMSDIMGYFDKYQVSEYHLDLGTGELKMTVKDENDPAKTKQIKHTVSNVALFNNQLYNDSYNYRQEYNKLNSSKPLVYDEEPIKDRTIMFTLLSNGVLILILVGFMVFAMRQANGGSKIGQFAKANIKNQPNNLKKVTFKDVAGADEEVFELQEIVDFLKNSKKYNDIGARVPKGVLLLGPPGTGKTLLARAVAGEANVPFFNISGSDFVELYVGMGAKRVRDLFEQAKKNSPAIIFIDEIDAVGRQRGTGLGGGHDEREQTLNQLLVEMDGFSGSEGVIVIAATNRRDILDPALLRPGRFDRQILVSYPDGKGREEILKVHTRNVPLGPDVDLHSIAQATVGFTGADLENLVNEAGLLSARKNKKAITKEEMDEAAIKVIAGPEKKSRVVSKKERELTAFHEGGHAICTYYANPEEKVHQVSIIPRGGAGGFTMSLPEHDKSFVSKNEMKAKITVLLGGRVAEKLILDDISTGASNDLERATAAARSMVTRYGFSEKLGPVVYGTDQHEVFLGRDFNSSRNYSENVAAEIDSEIRQLIEDAYQSAEDILKEHMDKLHFIAKYLMKFEKIDGIDFVKLMKGEMSEEMIKGVQEIKEETGEDISLTNDSQKADTQKDI